MIVSNPSEWFDRRTAQVHAEYYEPRVKGTIISPADYLPSIMELCNSMVIFVATQDFLSIKIHFQRGQQVNVTNIDSNRLNIQYILPLNEIVTNFYDELKSISSGYASFDYEDAGFIKSDLVKLGKRDNFDE